MSIFLMLVFSFSNIQNFSSYDIFNTLVCQECPFQKFT